MSFNHTVTISYQAGHEASVGASLDLTGESEVNLSGVSVPVASPDTEVICGLRYSGLKSLFILSTHDLSVETNDGTTPDDTITLNANVPYLWLDATDDANPLTADVTSLFLTATGTGTATVPLRALQDATP